MQSSSLWQAVLGEIELSISRGNFVTWFKNTCLLKDDPNHFVIGVPNVFIKQQLERKYNELVKETLTKNGANPGVIEYKIHSSLTPVQREEDPLVSTGRSDTNQTTVSTKAPATTALTHTYRQGLND